MEDDSVVFQLEIKHPVAKRYFDYQLGRMHAVELNDVKEYENAIFQGGPRVRSHGQLFPAL